jgi:hypothetical protein
MISRLEFDKHLEPSKNCTKVTITIKNIKVIIATNLYLAFLQLDIDTFIIGTETSDFGIGAILYQL